MSQWKYLSITSKPSRAHVFPHDNIVVGLLILMVGVGFHWIGQLVSVINREFATRMGLQESKLPKEYKFVNMLSQLQTLLSAGRMELLL